MTINVISAPVIETSGPSVYNTPYARTVNYSYVPMAVYDAMTQDGVAAAFGVSPQDVVIAEDMWGSAVCLVKGGRRFPRGPVRELTPLSIDNGACLIFPGQNVVAAPHDCGKTPVGYHICDSLNGSLVNWGEPFPDSMSEEIELGMMILKAMEHSNVVVIDSYKDLARNAGGTTMSDGLSSYFFTLISKWSGHYSSFGVYVVSLVNFATGNDAAVDSAVRSLHSNSSSVIWTEEAGAAWHWKGRPGIGRQRSTGTFNISWGKDRINKLVNIDKKSDEQSGSGRFFDLGVYARSSPDILTRAARSTFRQSK